MAFIKAKGLLPLPVEGGITTRFGDKDTLGSIARGLSVMTRPEAQVRSPVDGWVVYAGPFRSYGQLLILDAGDGYHIVMSGMKRMNVQLGQFVLLGEPVGGMGNGAAVLASQNTSPASSQDGIKPLQASQPVLYVEFRKDGQPIDSAPWWSMNVAQNQN
jgi:murein hydrolase activator